MKKDYEGGQNNGAERQNGRPGLRAGGPLDQNEVSTIVESWPVMKPTAENPNWKTKTPKKNCSYRCLRH